MQRVVKFPCEVGSGVRQAMPELAWPSGRCRLAGNDVGRLVHLAKRSRQIAADHQFCLRRVVLLKLAGAFQRLVAGRRLSHRHRTDDSLQLAKRNYSRPQDGRRVAGEVEHGGLDADVARSAVEHQWNVAAKLIDDVLRPGWRHAARAVRAWGRQREAAFGQHGAHQRMRGAANGHGWPPGGDDVRNQVGLGQNE